MDVPAGTARQGKGGAFAVSDAPHHWLLDVPSQLHSHTCPRCSHCGKQRPVQLLLSFGLAARTSKWWAEKEIIFQDRKLEVKMCLDASSHGAEGVQFMMEMEQDRPCIANVHHS